jgi:hypothetical protein
MSWEVVFEQGPAEELFRATDSALLLAGPNTRIVRVLTVSEPTIVLGSAQSSDVLRSVPNGVAVVRRRSGGGAVWLDPDAMVWFDVIIGSADPLWQPDVGRSMWWVGELFTSLVGSLIGSLIGPGRESAVEVHRGGMVRHELDRLVCWTGLGAGEVTAVPVLPEATDPARGAARPKVVGVAQKRVRTGALFQVGVLLAHSQYLLAPVVGVDPEVIRASEFPIGCARQILTDGALERFDALG